MSSGIHANFSEFIEKCLPKVEIALPLVFLYKYVVHLRLFFYDG